MKKKITIAVPCYNVEKYLQRCLDSLLKQDLHHSEYEIIAINDGSTDGTYNIISNYAEKYSNIVAIDKVNEGLGLTRNLAINKASGEYILFVDSDDYIEENCLSRIYNEGNSQKLDILEFGFKNVNDNGEEILPPLFSHLKQRPCGIRTGREYILELNDITPMVWNRAYNTDFLKRHNLIMAPICHEDEEFTPRALYYAQKMCVINECYYNYVSREGSITSDYKIRNYFGAIIAMGNLNKFANEAIDKNDKMLLYFFHERISSISIEIFKRSIRNKTNIQRAIIKSMKKLDIYPIRNINNNQDITNLNLSPYLFTMYFRKTQNSPLKSCWYKRTFIYNFFKYYFSEFCENS